MSVCLIREWGGEGGGVGRGGGGGGGAVYSFPFPANAQCAIGNEVTKFCAIVRFLWV